jgi:stage III sporulation protein AA
VKPVQPFESAVRALPQHLRSALMSLPESVKNGAEEIRLRAGQVMTVYAPEAHPAGVNISAHDLAKTLENVSHGSLHTVLESLRNGFIFLPGGHRMGVCGSAAVRDGAVMHIRDISSLCIRVAKEKKGISEKLFPSLLMSGRLPNTLIVSPPGAGKTTLLRDLIRIVSDRGFRVSVADERGEIAACFGGMPQLDVGGNTDVLTGISKADASMMLLRGMTPQVLALDEITAPEDASVITACIGCGVTVISTAHASGADDLRRRPVYRGLLEIFERLIVISGTGGSRKYDILEVRESCMPQSASFVSL